MPGPQVILGRWVTGGSADFMVVGAGTQRSTVGPASSGSGQVILQRLGGRVGMYGSTGVYYRLFLQATSSGVPGNVINGNAYTDEHFTDSPFNGSYEGRWVEHQIPITVVDENQLLAFGSTARNGVLSVGMDVTTASAIYQRNTSSGTIPGDGYTSVPANGRMHIGAKGERNVAPNRPGAITVSGGVGNRRPTMTASFSDPNETLLDGRSYDRLERIHEEYWWGGQLRHIRTVTATTSERNNRQSSRQAWFDIPFDTPYTYYVYHIDRLGEWSPSRSYSGTVFSGAVVDTPTSPSGRVTNPANPGSIVARYTNNGGLSTNAVQFRIVSGNGSPITTSSIIPLTVAPNANISRTWAQAGFGTQPNGTTRGVQVRARATNGAWSNWSDATWFTTNAAPNMPSHLSPASGTAASTLPTIRFAATDPDQSSSSLTTQVEVRDASGTTVLGTVAGVKDPNWVNDWTASVSSIITSYQTFTWRVRSHDGYLYSDWTPLQTYTYAAVPSVSITGPAGPTISTSQPTITWSSTNQTHWRVRGWDGSRLVYDTGQIAGTAQLHTIASEQYWQGGERWNNDETFQWEVLVRDATTLWGSSALLSLTLEYPPIDPLIIDGSAESLPGIAGTHYNRVFTTMTEYPAGEFQGYHRRRVAVTGLNGAEIPGTAVKLPTEMNPNNTEVRDYDVVSNQWYRYTVWQEVRIGNDVIASPEVSIDLMASWYGILLHSNGDPESAHVWLKFGAPGGRWEPSISERLVRDNIGLRGRQAPVAVVSGQRDLSLSGEYTLLTTDDHTAMDQLVRLYTVNDWQYKHLSPNGRPNGICYRSGQGGPRGLVYVTMNIRETPFTTRAHVVELDFEEYSFTPFEEVAT